jgi:Asp-tRNA(Asn)/Glu-tRNA(Gln) amidotransferase A subunit family amidase
VILGEMIVSCFGFWRPAETRNPLDLARTAGRLARADLAVREIDLPADYDRLSDAQHLIVQDETARLFDLELGAARERLDIGVRELLEEGLAIDQGRYNAAQDLAHALRRRFAVDLGDADLLMVPGSEGEPPPVSRCGSNIFIRIWMMLHVPVLSLPIDPGPTGMPLSMQLIGRPEDDAIHLARARRVLAALAATA